MARNYVKERLNEPPERKQERSDRNKARRVMEKAVGKKALQGKDVHHVRGKVTGSPKATELAVVAPAVHNHGRKGAQGGRLKKGGK